MFKKIDEIGKTTLAVLVVIRAFVRPPTVKGGFLNGTIYIFGIMAKSPEIPIMGRKHLNIVRAKDSYPRGSGGS